MFKTWDSLAHLLIVTRTLSQLAKITSVGIWTRQECQEVGGIIIVTPLLFHHTSSSSYNIHTYTGVLVCFRALPFYMNALLTDAQTHTHTHTHIGDSAAHTSRSKGTCQCCSTIRDVHRNFEGQGLRRKKGTSHIY